MKNKTDFNKVNLQLITDAWDHIGESLLNIINSTGVFSNIWKTSVVVTFEKIKGACVFLSI